MERTLMVAVVLLSAQAARAEDTDAAFQSMVNQLAQEGSQYVESWWAANLDNDPALERVAVLCPTGKDDKKGFFIIEKDAARRWEIAFDFDSRTKACKGKPAAAPKFEKRKATTVDLYQGHLQGYETTSYAIRVGQPVIVRDEVVEGDSKKPVVKDWDALIKRKKEKNYQVPESLRQLN